MPISTEIENSKKKKKKKKQKTPRKTFPDSASFLD